jgi:tetratricopeptide (TPR) repeat protein
MSNEKKRDVPESARKIVGATQTPYLSYNTEGACVSLKACSWTAVDGPFRMSEEEREGIAFFCAGVDAGEQVAYGAGNLTAERIGKNSGLPHAAQKETPLDKGEASEGNSPLSARQKACSAEDEGRKGPSKVATAGRSGTRKDRKATEGRRLLSMSKDIIGEKISDLIEKGKMPEARAILVRELRKAPYDHWLLDRLSETYYEEGKIARALQTIKKAHVLNPECPLVLWDYANTLEEVGQPAKAIVLYKQLLNRSIQEIACGECGEGLPWAESLLADTAYRVALCYQQLSNFSEAWRYLLKHVSMREQGVQSIYPEKEVRESLSKLTQIETSSPDTPEPSIVFWGRTQTIQT